LEAIKLIKFGSHSNMEDLYQNGIVFMNTVEYFRHFKDEKIKGDELEGLSYILRNTHAEIFHQETRILYGDKANFFFRNEEDIGNVYCLTALWQENLSALINNEFEVDLNLAKMGNSFVLIHYPKLFMAKLFNELNKLDLEFKVHAVKYLDVNTTEGEYGVFAKPLEYAYQMEVRVFVKTEGIKPLPISIGSLHEIATIHPIEELLLNSSEK
jgi:hypothetical protein